MAKKVFVHHKNDLGLRVFEYFYRNRTKDFDYFLTYSERREKIYSKFLENCQKNDTELGITSLIRYVGYQFEFYKSTKIHGKDIFGWIFGQKAFDRWLNKSEEYWLYHLHEYFQHIGIDEFDIQDELIQEENISFVEKDDFLRQNVLDSQKLFLFCTQQTTGPSLESRFCPTCPHLSRCKKYFEHED